LDFHVFGFLFFPPAVPGCPLKTPMIVPHCTGYQLSDLKYLQQTTPAAGTCSFGRQPIGHFYLPASGHEGITQEWGAETEIIRIIFSRNENLNGRTSRLDDTLIILF
jgi:hypothetical protein